MLLEEWVYLFRNKLTFWLCSFGLMQWKAKRHFHQWTSVVVWIHLCLSPPLPRYCLFSFAPLSLWQEDEQIVGTVLTASKAKVFWSDNWQKSSFFAQFLHITTSLKRDMLVVFVLFMCWLILTESGRTVDLTAESLHFLHHTDGWGNCM